jgi:DNA-binding MarR family transcriptional regulator
VPYLKEAPVSHDATAWAKAQKTGSSPAKFILMVLADFAGTDYSCYPSVKKLADITEMSESTVRSATKTLCEQGLIRVFYRYRDNHTRRSSRYQLLVDGAATMEPDADDWAHQRQEPAEVHRQESEGTPQELADSHRRELAVIPHKDPSLRDPSVVIPGASRTARATRIPDNFQPDENMRAWFVAENLHTVIDNPRAAHDDFCDYWRAKAGADARKIDWPATWRRWMRTAASRAGRGGGFRAADSGYKPSTTDQRVAQGLALAEKFRKLEEESK